MRGRAKPLKVKPIAIEGHCAVFKAELRRGVPYVSDTVLRSVETIAAFLNVKIDSTEGDFSKTKFYFDRYIDEDEAERVEREFGL